MFIDSHAHLYLKQFAEDIDKVIMQAQAMNVKKIFLPNIDHSTINELDKLASTYPEICYPMMGLHPCSVHADFKKELVIVKSKIESNRYYGIGETGIDLYWDLTFKKEQIESFEEHIALAIEFKLPIIIHSRDSLDLTIDIIEQNKCEDLRGIFHCFNGSIDQCKRICDLQFHMGMGGVVTYKNAGLDDMVKYMPLDLMLLETDAPYLSPVPHRGKRNETAYIPLIAAKIAELRNQALNEIMTGTTINAVELFGIENN